MIRLLAFLLAVAAGDALAHAALVGSDPGDGVVLERAPSSMALQFNEPVTPTALRLVGSSTSIALSGSNEGNTVRADFPESLAAGAYLLSYRVVSADSHPVGGSIAFSIGKASAPLPRSETIRLSNIGGALLRVVHDLALLIAAGASLFVLLVRPFPMQRRVLVIATVVCALSALALVGVQGAALTDVGPWATDAWRVGFTTTRATAALWVIAGAVAIIAGVAVPVGRASVILLAGGTVVLITSFAISGHAASVEPRSVAILILLHTFAAAFWIGSLVALLLLLRTSKASEISDALARFSRLGIAAVLALVVAGVSFAATQIVSAEQLIDTRYGWLVSLKATIFVALIGFAVVNRSRYLPALRRGDSGIAVRLRRAMLAELVLITGAIAAAALLAQTRPPRTEMIGAHADVRQGGHIVRVDVIPATTGINAISLTFRTTDGVALDPVEVLVDLTAPHADIGAVARQAKRVAAGEYRVERAELVLAGAWSIDVKARLTDFDVLTIRTAFTVR